MKLIREYLYEKFSDESDPIEDMGIGVYSKHDFKTGQEALDFIWEIFPYLFDGKIPDDIIKNSGQGFFAERYSYSRTNPVREYCKKYIYVNGKNIIDHAGENPHIDMWQFNNALHNALMRAGYQLSDEAKKDKRYKNARYDDISKLRIKN